MRDLSLALIFLLLLLLTALPYSQPAALVIAPVEVILTSEPPPTLTCEAPYEEPFTPYEELFTPYEEPSKLGPIIQQVMSMYRIDAPLAEQIVIAVSEQSAAYDMDPWLILAFIKVESYGRPQAVGASGERGLMQLMPSTGEDIAKNLGDEWIDADQLFDIETNIRYGVWYLSEMFKLFPNQKTAIAAYNWGPGRIERRLKRKADVPEEYPLKVLTALSTTRENF